MAAPQDLEARFLKDSGCYDGEIEGCLAYTKRFPNGQALRLVRMALQGEPAPAQPPGPSSPVVKPDATGSSGGWWDPIVNLAGSFWDRTFGWIDRDDDFAKGDTAYNKGDHKTARVLFERAARKGLATAQYPARAARR
jgi:hypothetical protein